jgi:hypothetical protein
MRLVMVLVDVPGQADSADQLPQGQTIRDAAYLVAVEREIKAKLRPKRER